MPATLDKSIILSACPYIIYEEEFSAINAGEAFDLSWTAAEGPALLPFKVELETTTNTTDRSPIFLVHNRASSSASGRTVNITLDTVAGGSVTGGVVTVRLWFLDQASGGTS